MKTPMCLALIPLFAGFALAQDTKSVNASSSSSRSTMNDMQTQKFKGTLVDAACSPSSTQETAPAESSKTKKSEKANRVARVDQGSSCPPSANTNQFALKTNDGKLLKFDSVGNLRAQEAMKNKKWSEHADKPIHAKVNGLITGETLTVLSLD